MTEDDLAEILGEEIVEKVRKSIVKKHSKSTPKTTKAAVQFKSRKEDKKFSWNDAFSEFK